MERSLTHFGARAVVLAVALASWLALGAFTPGAWAAPPPWAKGAAEKPCHGGDTVVTGQGPSCRVVEGLWKVKLRNGASVLTHGPDLKTNASTPGAVLSAGAAATPRQPVCSGSNANGNYYLVAILAWPSDGTHTETDASFRSRINAMNGALHDAAVESGSPSGSDFVFACDSTGQVRVDDVQLPTPAASANFSTIVSDLQAKGYNKSNEKYVIWYDSPSTTVCGTATLYFDDRQGAANYNDIGPDWAVAFKCDSLLHETGHTIGAVQQTAPYSTGTGGHCWQEYDVMCYADGGSLYPGSLLYTCTDVEHFDCDHNDYFDAKIGAGQGGGSGSYLDTHWNLAECDNRFLINYVCPGTSPPGGVDYRSSVLSSGPVAYYRLGETSGTGAADSSGNGHPGTYSGGVTLGAAGALSSDANTAASFDGQSGVVSLSGLPVNTAAAGKNTVEFWMYWDGAPTRMPFAFGAYDLIAAWGLFGFNTGQGDVDGVLSSGLANRWVHVVAVFTNGDVSQNKLYIDGVQQAISAHGAAAARNASSTAVIGGWTYGGYNFSGRLDEVAIYNRELTASEVTADYNAR